MYNLVVFLHVLLAIVGLGPTVSMAVWQTAFREPSQVLTVLRGAQRLERLVITPGGTLTILTGLLLVPMGGHSFSQGWIALPVLLSAITLGIVHGILKPANQRMIAELERHGKPTPQFLADVARVRRFAPIGPLSIVLITYLMVVKPF